MVFVNNVILQVFVGIENMEMYIHVAIAFIVIPINRYPVFNELSFVQCEYHYR